MADLIDDLSRIVYGPVIGAKLYHGQAERLFRPSLFRINLGRLFSQVVLMEAVFVDSADKSVGISGGFQIERIPPDWIKAAL